MNVQFSIIIPTYNRAYLISTPIESIINQTYDNWELVIIDDGSTDNTQEVVNSYKDERIRYFWQENQERSAARNKGIELATGDWICFLDSDDLYKPDFLRQIYQSIDSDVKIIRGKMDYVDSKGEVICSAPSYNGENQLYFVGTTIGAVSHVAFRAEIAKQYKFSEIKVFEDVDFLLRILEQYQFKSIDYVGVNQINHSERSQYDAFNYSAITKSLVRVEETVNSLEKLTYKQQTAIFDQKMYNILHKCVYDKGNFLKLLRLCKKVKLKYIFRALYYTAKKMIKK